MGCCNMKTAHVAVLTVSILLCGSLQVPSGRPPGQQAVGLLPSLLVHRLGDQPSDPRLVRDPGQVLVQGLLEGLLVPPDLLINFFWR